MFAEKSCGAQPPIISHAFLKDDTAKTFPLQDGFFFSEETSCVAVISQAIFSDGALKT